MASGQEDSKNLALLFFMDHLMTKSGKRTIHDLSCQFGARGFTQEMRDSVGGTQEGLLEFLHQYPSLFAIDGDTVTLKGFGEIALTGGIRTAPVFQAITRERDIDREAIEFFETKLQKFGPELQIKSLLGHRSQAAPEIRLYSGRHVKDFTEFLASHHEYFIVEGDRVRLKNVPEPMNPELEFDENGEPLTGDRAKDAATEYLRQYLDAQEVPMPIEQLYKEVCTRFSQNVRQEVATNPKELMQFLKLNRNLFFIRSNKVSIVRNRDDLSDVVSETGGSTVESPYVLGVYPPTANGGEYTIVPVKDFVSVDVLHSTTVCKTLKSAQEAVQETAAMYTDNKAACLPGELANVVAMDFKMVSLGGTGQEFLAMITVGTPFGKLYVFDVSNSASILLESGLKDLLEADDYIKVIHDCKRICGLLWEQYEVSVRSVFDTQVANTVLQHQRTGRPLHEIKAVSFLTLQRLYCPQSLLVPNDGPKRTQKPDQKYWALRPLNDEMIRLAVEQVNVLIPVIYMAMNGSIRPELRDLFWHLCRENADYFIKYPQVHQQRQERRNQYVMEVINEKLMHDPTGASLTNREKVLAHAEQDDTSTTASMESQETGQVTQNYYIPCANGDLIGSTMRVDPPSPAASCCQCQCHNKASTADAASQTVSTGDIWMGQ